jgi:4-hydroxythreonine-4-phosphate dehydrogenase
MTLRRTDSIAIAAGDPAGIGPSITMQALAAHTDQRFIVFGDRAQLEPLRARHCAQSQVEIRDVGTCDPTRIAHHKDDPECGAIALLALDAAITSALSGESSCVVTGPVSTAAIPMSGKPFVGQTEHLAARAGLLPDDVTMLFLGPILRVGLVTTHLSVRDIPDAITSTRVERTVRHLGDALSRLRAAQNIATPSCITVCGLNPHAGEHGLFGDEEIRVLEPLLQRLRADEAFAAKTKLIGPSPAESVFRDAQAKRIDGVVAMFHDQATIASKLLDWGNAVNVTWGLPFLRTSVDHGVAFDAAKQGKGDADGMHAAIQLALDLTSRSSS